MGAAESVSMAPDVDTRRIRTPCGRCQRPIADASDCVIPVWTIV